MLLAASVGELAEVGDRVADIGPGASSQPQEAAKQTPVGECAVTGVQLLQVQGLRHRGLRLGLAVGEVESGSQVLDSPLLGEGNSVVLESDLHLHKVRQLPEHVDTVLAVEGGNEVQYPVLRVASHNVVVDLGQDEDFEVIVDEVVEMPLQSVSASCRDPG